MPDFTLLPFRYRELVILLQSRGSREVSMKQEIKYLDIRNSLCTFELIDRAVPMQTYKTPWTEKQWGISIPAASSATSIWAHFEKTLARPPRSQPSLRKPWRKWLLPESIAVAAV